MKMIILLSFAILVVSCGQGNDNDTAKLQQQVDSLQKQLNGAYRPGLGEFMMGVQEHHAKLWFAGINQNWPLADFEVHEIGETVDDIKKYCTDRPEVKSIGIIDPAIGSINAAIKQKSTEQFKKAFTDLTNSCNNCHKDNQHGFNVITIPSGLPVENQKFKPGK
ncbi:hypothetical protein [Mucilaginibacter sp.]|jgi:hypothetical protein|uniref:hypothetical protein n=1 Tax=Mucilaginibacter sp. TaxID=1882438 RepID=UPI002C590014|nr:hypothetical protein [Mucilaginibacter sp.]HTI57770.1 hypothetical protein [Mucilaginibacter sp.]